MKHLSFVAVILALLVFAVSLLMPPSARAQPAPLNGPEAVISQQLQAFDAEDFDRAWGYASPTIQGVFGTVDNFGAMVRDGYPMVHHSRSHRFAGQDERGGRTYQKVEIEDTDGRLHLLEYAMIQTPEGWKIDAVRMLKMPGLAV
ncbi:DUF4864 domain-containing protein [Pseudooceanicola sediminis]|uniref:DUF4864 domain-containing protein n=1 Tax=Pseudooceanicola sediminis TaxID=2211117 RepID=A0A399IZJ6_9RHOB|nr:DUF4864 domain-containing protein [Pseudooceanicola sediminis]KAA2313712.1 DUF4864 domain-containing protein [Puniceibacterium sp. HSS470]RII38451.1 DUF4864 domain-containing protein [Pseudooceanicola sediminis]|tara:strand:- start:130642 stop:131076 length:435 start_codon:yes stop_codon:yes gene_type:complete